MILQWLLYLALLPALLGVAVAVSEPWLRSHGVPTRFAWIGAMTTSLLWAIVAALPPRVSDAVSGKITHLPPVLVEVTGAYVRASAPVRQSIDDTAPFLLALAIASALLGLGRLAHGWFRLRAERATWQRSHVDGCEVLVSRDRGPGVVGVKDPVIVLPEWLTSADRGIRQVVLRHEREHTAARDVTTLLVARVLQALLPWSPGIRWVGARLSLAVEHDCDLRVLRSGVDRHHYEATLLAVAERITASPLIPALSERASHLERRITAMRTLNRRHSALRPAAACAFALAALFAAFMLPGAGTAIAQSLPTAGVSGRSVARDTVYFEFQVDRPVAIDSMARAVYPAEQRAAGVRGEVLAQFVVDTLGRMEPGSLKILKSDHGNFSASVRQSVEASRFKPAMKGGQKVRQLVQMPFVFSLDHRSDK